MQGRVGAYMARHGIPRNAELDAAVKQMYQGLPDQARVPVGLWLQVWSFLAIFTHELGVSGPAHASIVSTAATELFRIWWLTQHEHAGPQSAHVAQVLETLIAALKAERAG